MRDNLPVSNEPFGHGKRIGWVLCLIIAAWSLLVVGIYVWDSSESYKAEMKTAIFAARDSINKDVIYRRWSAMQGGVYVLVSKRVPPNPYLKHIPERDVVTPSGRQLTLVNPAYMTRQVHDLGNAQYGVKSHITSLKPIRPQNAPDSWERKALLDFEKGTKEVASLEKLDNKTYLRLMLPLTTEQSCLKCHATQGYKIGDIRGGISVSVPWAPYRGDLYRQSIRHIGVFLLIWLLGIVGVILANRRLQHYLHQQNLADKALRYSEANLREAQDIARMGRWELDLSTNRVTWSNYIFDLFEVNRDTYDPSYERFMALVHPDDRAMVKRALQESIENSEPREIEHRIVMKDGRIKWVNLIGRTELDDAGNPVKSIGTAQDITDRKTAEWKLQTSEERFFAFFDKGPIGYQTLDAEGLILDANSTSLALLGLDREEVVGKPFSDFIAPEHIGAFLSGFPLLRAVGEIHSEFQILRKNGKRRFISFEGRISHDAEGRGEQTHCILFDITERKYAEESLRSKSALLEAQTNASPDGILVIDENLKRLLINRRMIELVNPPPHILNTDDDNVLLEHVLSLTKYPEQFLEKITYLNDHPNETSRDEIEFKSGMILDRHSAPVLGTDGKYYGRIWTFRDITERKQVERRQQLSVEILGILNQPGQLEDAINRVLSAVKLETGFDAVGLRLRTGDDFPYFAQQGFSEEFLLAENTLAVRDAKRDVCRNQDGSLSLECTCGLVLSGQTDPTNSLLTPGGSFWTNDSLPLLDIPEDQEPRTNPRNRCIHEGFLSVALIPIRAGGEIVGLLQLNDRRKDRLTLDMVRYFEGISSSIGLVLMKKQADEALRQSEERFKLVATNIPDHIIIQDADLRYVWVLNPQLGLKVEDMIGKTDFDFLAEDDAIALTTVKRRILATGKEEHFPAPLVSSDGTVQHFDGVYVPRRDAQGTVDGLIGYFRNVTERKAMEDALRESEEKFAKVFRDAPVWIAITDLANGTYLDVNEEALRASGFTRDEVIGHTAEELGWLRPDDRPRLIEMVEKHGRIAGMEMAFHTRDGRTLYGWVKGELLDIGGCPSLLTCTVDITERNLAEEALRNSEEMFRSMAEQLVDVLFTTDDQGVLTFISQSARNVFGWLPDEMVGHPFMEFLQEDQIPIAVRALRDNVTNRTSTENLGLTMKHKDGSLFDGEVSASASQIDGNVVGTLGLIRDVTERNLAEAALKASEEHLVRAELMGEFGSWEIDIDTRMVSASEGAKSIYGAWGDELTFDVIKQAPLPEYRPKLDNALRALVAEDKPYDVEFKIQREVDGSVIDIHSVARYDKSSNMVFGVIQDVTERRRAEEDLRLSQQWLELQVQQTPLAVIGFDVQGRVQEWNPAAVKIFGFSREEAVGQYWTFIVPEEIWGQLDGVWESIVSGKGDGRSTNANVTKNGNHISCEWFSTAIVDRDGNTIGVASLIMDVTERKQAEKALLDSEAKYKAIVETFPLAVHLSVGEEQISEYVNPTFIKLFGYQLEDIPTGDQWWLFAYPDEAYRKQVSEEWATKVKRAIDTQSPIEPMETVVTCKDGSEKIISWGFIALGDRNYSYGLDLTERKIAERALIESEARLRSLVTSMAEGVAIHDIIMNESGEPINYRITDVNPRYEAITLLRAEDVLGKLATEAYGTPEAPYLAEYTAPCKTMKSASMETYFPPMDKHFIISIAPLSADSFATIFFDVTEQKRVEKAIRASEANYRTIFDTAGDAMIVHDAESGRIVDVNRKCCEMFGYTRKEMRGLVTADISADEPAYTQDNALRWMRRAIKGKSQLFEWKGRDRSGLVFWVEISLKRVTISGEHRVIAAVRDISQRKHFEEAVTARAFWEGIAQTMQSGLVVVAPNGTLSFANEAFYNLVGYACDELVSMPPPYPWMGEHPHNDPLLSGKEMRNQQATVRHKSGKLIPVIVSVSDLKDEQGNTISRFAVYQDISSMVDMEEQLARSERLALLGQLAGSIGHELRNPLGVVQSSVYYLRSKLKDQDEKITRHLDRLENSVAFSDKVITDLLSFARIPNLAKQPIAMDILLRKLSDEFVANEKVIITVNVETDRNIMADETQMTQLFRNLISNAYDAMPDGGQLGISIRPAENNTMEIGVSDTGQGMPEEVLAKAFEPLYTTKARGAGFGLSICKNIVESHGGSISITSEPGKGTQVSVSFPM